MSEKLQKVLARAGLGSRREMEAAISAGRVSINGTVATLGERVSETDQLRFDGQPVRFVAGQSICRVLAYHKPEGEVVTRKDPEGRTTVFDRLPPLKEARWVAIGRLDINTSGLLLFTTDGELANRLMHPSHEVEREYAVRVFGDVDEAMLQRLRRGVQLEDGMASFKKIMPTGGEGMNHWFNVILTEGRNREVRRLWESQEVQVSRLIRTRYGEVRLPKGLPRGAWEELPLSQVNYLRKLVDLRPETETKVGDKQQRKTSQARIRRAIRKHQLRQSSPSDKPRRTRQR